MTENTRYTIGKLAAAAGVTPRTVRYYTAEGLLPPPQSEGKYAVYSDTHRSRLLLIQRLKNAFMPLDAIRIQLADLTDAQIENLLAQCDETPEAETPPRLRMTVGTAEPRMQSSEEYIAQILAVTGQSAGTPETPAKPRRALLVSETFRPTIEETPAPPTAAEREIWQRVMLEPGAELHIKMPEVPRGKERIERLIAAVQTLFKEEPHE